jgi:hypothetical protein
VDIKVETGNFATEKDYIFETTTKILNSGFPMVIWITTQSRKLMRAEPGKDRIVADWIREVELLEGL